MVTPTEYLTRYGNSPSSRVEAPLFESSSKKGMAGRDAKCEEMISAAFVKMTIVLTIIFAIDVSDGSISAF